MSHYQHLLDQYSFHVVPHGDHLCPGFFVSGFGNALPRRSCLGIGDPVSNIHWRDYSE